MQVPEAYEGGITSPGSGIIGNDRAQVLCKSVVTYA